MAGLGLGVYAEHGSPELFFIVFPLLGGLVCCRRIVTFSLREAFLPSSVPSLTVGLEG